MYVIITPPGLSKPAWPRTCHCFAFQQHKYVANPGPFATSPNIRLMIQNRVIQRKGQKLSLSYFGCCPLPVTVTTKIITCFHQDNYTFCNGSLQTFLSTVTGRHDSVYTLAFLSGKEREEFSSATLNSWEGIILWAIHQPPCLLEASTIQIITVKLALNSWKIVVTFLQKVIQKERSRTEKNITCLTT